MKKENKNLILVIFLAIFIMTNFVSAQECFSDIQCFNAGGQFCRTDDNGNYLVKKFICENEACIEKIVSGAGCCTSLDCASDQTCDNNFKCVGGRQDYTSSDFEDESNQTIKSQNNSIVQSLIIALGIIVGLIVLGLLIKKRSRN